MKKNILITGANGFIGKHVVKYLISKNKKIKIIARKKNNLFKNKNIKIFYTKNLFKEKENNLKNFLKNVNTVIHLAWFVKPNNYLNSEKNIECLIGTINLAEACAQSKVKNFIGIGTCFEYKISNKKISVNSALEPKNLYSATKLSVYFSLLNFFNKKKINFSWLRLFYISGDDDYEQKLIPYIIKNLKLNKNIYLTKDKKIKDYMTVQNVAEAICKISLKSKKKPVYNICSGHPITIRKIANNLGNKYKKKHLIKFVKSKKRSYDPDYIVGIPNY
jgi:nucleoside-diphosphate-sugar epimerase